MFVRRITEEVEAEANSAVFAEEELKSRPVVTGITVDGVFSKDLDDGIYLTKRGDNYLLQVSISDVSSLVKPGTELYSYAYNMVSTRYYATSNDPMLPRILSEDKLSLIPRGLRPAITFDIELQPNGEVCKFGIRETAFKNRRRLNYGQFDKIADKYDEDYDHLMFKEMAFLASNLLDYRRGKGALAIYDLVKGIYTNEEGLILPLKKDMAHISNIVIQEFMILTNKTFAWYCAKNDIPILYRNHSVRQSAPNRNEILTQINTAILNSQFLEALRNRSVLWFNRAKYSPYVEGHYGLNEPVYTHVTSPIRRLPDLINHHIIKAWIHSNENPFKFENLIDISENINKVNDEIRDDRTNIFKQLARTESQKLGLSSVEALREVKPNNFVEVLRKAIEDDNLSDNIDTVLKERFESGNVDLNMVYVLLVKNKNNGNKWLEFKKKSFLYLCNNIGRPVQLLHILLAKGFIEKFDYDIKESEDGYNVKIYAIMNGVTFSPDDYSYGLKKRDASHDSALHLLKLILDIPQIEIPQKGIIEEKIELKLILEAKESEEQTFASDLIDVTPNKTYEELSSLLNIEADQNTETIIDSTSENVKEEQADDYDKFFENTFNKEPNPLQSNYIGRLQELIVKFIGWKLDYKYEISGVHHSPTITCTGKLITPEFTIEKQATDSQKKAAKNQVSKLIFDDIYIEKQVQSNQADKSTITTTENYVGTLQEVCVKKLMPQPVYDYEQVKFEPSPQFECRVTIFIEGKQQEFFSKGATKKSAKQAAAGKCIEYLK